MMYVKRKYPKVSICKICVHLTLHMEASEQKKMSKKVSRMRGEKTLVNTRPTLEIAGLMSTQITRNKWTRETREPAGEGEEEGRNEKLANMHDNYTHGADGRLCVRHYFRFTNTRQKRNQIYHFFSRKCRFRSSLSSWKHRISKRWRGSLRRPRLCDLRRSFIPR